MKKKLILLTCLCVLASGTYAYAADEGSVVYNITVNKTATDQDNLSKRCVRQETINDFEVTPTSFNTSNASFYAKSSQLYGDVRSYTIYVENGLNDTRYGNYTTDAVENELYYMSTSYGYSSTGVVNSTGVYRP